MRGDGRDGSAVPCAARGARALAVPPPNPPERRGARWTSTRSQMRRALELAARGWGRVSPNPMVGAVVLRDDVPSWARAGTRDPAPRTPRSMALVEAGDRARGATVVLHARAVRSHRPDRPCTRRPDRGRRCPRRRRRRRSEPGRRRRRSSAAPGSGDRRRRPACSPTSRHRLNEAFDRHVTTGRPFVTLKMASSLDGKTAAIDGTLAVDHGRGCARRRPAPACLAPTRSWWVPGPRSRRRPLPHGARARVGRRRVPRSGWSSTPPAACRRRATCSTGRRRRSSRPSDLARAGRQLDAWGDAGAEVVVLDRDVAGGVSLDALLAALGKRDVQGVLIEGGATLAWSLVRDGLVDKVVQYLAPLARRRSAARPA